MNKLFLIAGWLVSLVGVYFVGWIRGVRSAANIAAGTTHFMANTVELLAAALVIAVAAAVGIYMSRPKTNDVILASRT